MRLDEIKERHEPGSVINYVKQIELVSSFGEEIRFLLSKLEEAEKAFKEITDYSNPTGEDGREMKQIAEEALQQLRS